MILLLLACSGQAEVPAHDAHPGHEHAAGERHGHALTDRAGRVFGSAELPEGPLARFVEGDESALDPQQQAGLEAFLQAGCAHCHAGPRLGGLDPEVPSLLGATERRSDLSSFLLEHGEAAPEQVDAIQSFMALLR